MHIICLFALNYHSIIVLSHNSCPEDCRCSNTSTSQLAVFCKGESLSHITLQLPANTVIYQYEAQEKNVNLGGTNFSHLTALESLQLTSPYDQLVSRRTISEILLQQQRVFWPLTNLKELKININWMLQNVLPELFSKLDKLETLDLSNTRMLNYMHLKNTLYSLENSTSLRVLNLGNTRVLFNHQNGFFLNLTDLLDPLKNCPLEELDISYNALIDVVPGLISKAPRLRKLDASNNLFTDLFGGPFFFEIFIHPTLVEADVSEQGLGKPKKIPSNGRSGMFEMTCDNAITCTDQIINTNQNLLSIPLYQQNKGCADTLVDDPCNIFSPACAELLHECTVNHQLFCYMFSIVNPYFAAIPCDFIPPVRSFLNTDCGSCIIFPLTGSLQKVHLQMMYNYNEMLALPAFINKTCINKNNSLEVVDISHNRKHGFPDIDLAFSTPIVGLDSMKVLNLSHNGIQHPASDLGHNLPQIEVLDLSYNLLDLQGKYGDFLAAATSVQELNLARNRIHEISYSRLATLSRLETLNLSSNSLQTLSVDIRNLSVLSYIDLSGNKIPSLSQDMITQLSAQAAKLHNTSLKIDLSHMTLLCTCNERYFTDWVLSGPNNVEFVHFYDYMCMDEALNQVPFHRAGHLSNFDCLSKNVYIGVGVGSGILFTVMVASAIIVIYRKRWWFRYHYFIARKMWLHHRRQEEEMCEFRYDVFVCYNRHDKDWVDEILQPKLEDENGISLCLHERDFELGGEIIEQVIDSIENSRKTLLILSPHFVRSNWCTFEMRMAHQQLFRTGHDVLLLAILKPLDGVEITKTLKALLEQKTYVEWSEDQYGQKLFWKKLISALDIPKRSHAQRIDEEGTDDVEAPLIQLEIYQPSYGSSIQA